MLSVANMFRCALACLAMGLGARAALADNRNLQAQPPASPLVWDQDAKEIKAREGETNISFIFHFTNTSPAEAIIHRVDVSCGCTTAKLPPLPWRIPAGGRDQLRIDMDLRGKAGTLSKGVLVHTTAGTKSLVVRAHIPPQTNSGMVGSDRARNMLVALSDRNAIFKNDCANCHVKPGVGKKGAELYKASCGICHDSEHRAGPVPDLHALKHETNHDYWVSWITYGKVGSMMPGFGAAQGGPLTEDQIKSLAVYLSKEISEKPKTVPALPVRSLPPAPAPAGATPPSP